MQRSQLIAMSLTLTLFVTGCAPHAHYYASNMRRNADVITQTEMETCGALDPYEALVKLRPGWLRPKVRLGLVGGRDGIPVVYAQNMRLGTVQELSGLRIEGIQEIRYVNPMDATTRWGMGHTSGVIELIWVDQSPR